MDFLPEDIDKYVRDHSQAEPDFLSKIDRDTHTNVLLPRMISGHLQGRVLSMLSKMICPKVVLEIGTFTGYSALSFAEGLPEDGKVITLDINEELESRVRAHFDASEYASQIDYRIGNALDLIPEIDEKLDLVFIDADKINYPAYYDLIFDKLNQGGFVIIDNVLWSGKVVESRRKKLDKDTAAIIDFNKQVHEDPRVENVLFPIRDGLMILRKL